MKMKRTFVLIAVAVCMTVVGCGKDKAMAENDLTDVTDTMAYHQRPLPEYLVGSWLMDRDTSVVIAVTNMVGTMGTCMAAYLDEVPNYEYCYNCPTGIPADRQDSICYGDMTISEGLTITMPLNRVFTISGCPDYLTLNASVVCDNVVDLTTDTAVYEVETDTWSVQHGAMWVYQEDENHMVVYIDGITRAVTGRSLSMDTYLLARFVRN